jgi:iron complex outermembrane receptor protein
VRHLSSIKKSFYCQRVERGAYFLIFGVCMRFYLTPMAAAMLAVFNSSFCASAFANETPRETPSRELGAVVVTGERPSSLPTYIPTVFESVTAEQLQTSTNATDSADALKYLPSLNVRKRYIGDYNHAVLASRASGTANSARSLVYADGILLSNLLGNGAAYTPRWGLVTPSEIERVDVLYGPFSAAYSGNSVGAVVDYQTRMSKSFEARAQVGGFVQNFKLYQTAQSFGGNQASASLGGKEGAWSWFINADRLHSHSQPLVYVNKLVSTGTAPTNSGMAVTGAITGLSSPQNQPWVLFGTTTEYQSEQLHAKAKVAYDFSSSVRASYTLGWWDNRASSEGRSYLRNTSGAAVFFGPVIVAGKQYTLAATDITSVRNQNTHLIHGLNLKGRQQGDWDWELAASLYDYNRDIARAPTVALPAANIGGAGMITDLNGTGWNTQNAKATWRGLPSHTLEFGAQREAYQLRTLVSNTSDWLAGGAVDSTGTRVSAFNGNSELHSVWAQDSWKISPQWRSTAGVRLENWQAHGGQIGDAAQIKNLSERNENFISPKFALAYAPSADWQIKTSIGRAVRMPTVAELYQGTISGNAVVNNNPNLLPEKSTTAELSVEREFNTGLGQGLARATYFQEHTRDALYSQTNFSVSPTVTNIQNVDAIRTRGLELAGQVNNFAGFKGWDVSSSVTYADSVITANAKNPASVGKQQPRVPNWRANLLVTYKPSAEWNTSLGLRFSGRQYSQLDNSDTNQFAYIGVSRYLVLDWRANYQVAKNWTLSAGIDNLTNAEYWAFHPYPKRTYHMQLKYAFK